MDGIASHHAKGFASVAKPQAPRSLRPLRTVKRLASFHRDVRAGLFPESRAGDTAAIGEFGERS
jgi:hypothetical protein